MPSRFALLLAAALVALAAAAPAAALAPAAAAAAPAAALAPAALVRYHDSGAWARADARVVRQARSALQARRDRVADPRRLVLVLDVDDTALSTYSCMARHDFARARLHACALHARLPAIPQTRALYRWARARGIGVVFITGRAASLRTLTIRALHRAGYDGRLALVMRGARARRESNATYKAAARARIERHGREVAVDLGDQRSDLAGGFARRTFKLPNPMYTLR